MPARVVLVDQAGEDPGRLAAQRGGVDAGVLQRLPAGLEQQALLGVHRQRLARGDAEELGVELAGVGEEAALARIAGARVVGIGVVEALQVPAAVGGELGDAVATLGDQLARALPARRPRPGSGRPCRRSRSARAGRSAAAPVPRRSSIVTLRR